MSRNVSNRSAKQGSPLLVGILIGMLIGAVFAAGIAWFLMKSPSPYLPPAKVSPAVRVPPPAVTVDEPSLEVESNEVVDNNKPRFEFYDMLTNKKSGESYKFSRPVENKPLKNKPSSIYVPQILQVGSFTAQADADKLKAKLALVGAEAHIEAANIPNRGVYYRVRLGPYNSDKEMNKMRTFLKQNDIGSTPMRAQ